jgi:uncharacterized protein (DUF1778 family)
MSTAGARRKAESPRRDTVMNIRLSAGMRELIDSAAVASGKTRSQFVLESASRHAMDVVLDQRLFSLDAENYAGFLDALDNPPEPPAKLRALFRQRAPWEG